jgi:hypothetical protein
MLVVAQSGQVCNWKLKPYLNPLLGPAVHRKGNITALVAIGYDEVK